VGVPCEVTHYLYSPRLPSVQTWQGERASAFRPVNPATGEVFEAEVDLSALAEQLDAHERGGGVDLTGSNGLLTGLTRQVLRHPSDCRERVARLVELDDAFHLISGERLASQSDSVRFEEMDDARLAEYVDVSEISGCSAPARSRRPVVGSALDQAA
jgi:hypothetical protein